MLPFMFVVSEEAATAIREAYEQDGELSAAIELRRLFSGITDKTEARACARIIAGWNPLPAAACQITPSFVVGGLGRRSPDRTRSPRAAITAAGMRCRHGGLAQTHDRPSRWHLMAEHHRKTLQTLLEDAARARRFAIVLDGDPAAVELDRYAEELEAEIARRVKECTPE